MLISAKQSANAFTLPKAARMTMPPPRRRPVCKVACTAPCCKPCKIRPRRKPLKPPAKVQDSATQIATQQVSEATRISDNVDEAFAKTRVGLQSTDATTASAKSATDEFKDYMSKTPEQRLRDSILQSMG
jgi:hypothetical protein